MLSRTRCGVLLATVMTLIVLRIDIYACPPGQYEQCGPFGLGCVCLPEIGGSVGDASEHLKHEIEGQTAGRALQLWIEGSRNTAVGTSQPIPMQIRRALSGYIEEDVMNRARFKVGDNGILNLAGLTIAYGDRVFGNSVAAVTLIDVIVFQNANDALNNASLWAHELTHVKQFRDWGSENFAISYARDPGSVENPAYGVGNGYSAWAGNRPPPFNPPSTFPPQPTGFPSGFVMLQCGCLPGFPNVAPEPRCATGSVRPVACNTMCRPGVPSVAYLCQ